jgi:hypothetical protein
MGGDKNSCSLQIEYSTHNPQQQCTGDKMIPSSADEAFARLAMRRILQSTGNKSLCVNDEQVRVAFDRWSNLGRPRPSTVSRFADEVAQVWTTGDVCRLRGGAAGFEAEISNIRLANTQHYGIDIGETVVKCRTLDLKVDKFMNNAILEIVTKPIMILAGDEGRPSLQEVLLEADDVIRRVCSNHKSVRLSDAFRGQNYRVGTEAENVQIIQPEGSSHSRLNVHYSAGVSLAGFIDLLQYTRTNGSFRAAVAAAKAKNHLNRALYFAEKTGHEVMTYNWPVHDLDAFKGFMALTYIQYAALAESIVGTEKIITKNFTVALSRTDLAQVRTGLASVVRDYLNSNHEKLATMIDITFPSSHNLLGHRAASSNGPTMRDYLYSAFMNHHTHPVKQSTVFGLMKTLQGLDYNLDHAGRPRLNPPLLVVELRHHAPTTNSANDLNNNFVRFANALKKIGIDQRPRTHGALQPHAPGPSGASRPHAPGPSGAMRGVPGSGSIAHTHGDARPHAPRSRLQTLKWPVASRSTHDNTHQRKK